MDISLKGLRKYSIGKIGRLGRLGIGTPPACVSVGHENGFYGPWKRCYEAEGGRAVF
jgi:hypothetical protein